jgi:hypothetical protein
MASAIAISVRRIDLRSLLFAMIGFGLISSFALAIVVTANQFERSRDCRGAFSKGFSSGFDTYRCDLTIKHMEIGLEISIPIQ